REGDRDGHGHLRQLLADRNCFRTLRIAGGGRQLGADRKLSPHPRYAGCRHGAAGSALSLTLSTGGRACIGDLAGWRSAAGRHRRRSIWGLYNAALGMIFGFGTAMLAEKGWTAAAAGHVTSLAWWLIAVSAPAGGFIGDRFGRHTLVMIGGFLVLAVLLIVAARTEYAIAAFVALGMGGLSAGPDRKS